MRRKSKNVIIIIITLLMTTIAAESYAGTIIIREKNKTINNLQAEIASLQEENRDVMNLYAEMQNEEQFNTSNEDAADQKYFSLERRIRFLYEKFDLDYDSDFYKGELKSE